MKDPDEMTDEEIQEEGDLHSDIFDEWDEEAEEEIAELQGLTLEDDDEDLY